MFIQYVHESTIKYLETKTKTERKQIGQFFTPVEVAKFMASLLNFSSDHINILDPGAGSGILTAGVCDAIFKNNSIKKISVHLCENNQDILGLLKENMEYIKVKMNEKGKIFDYAIKDENFILSNADIWNGSVKQESFYDIIISNPPYKKIGKDDMESVAMNDIVYGQPNIYFLFMAMAAKLLKQNGQMVFINPRSFASGAYFKKFRQWFFDNVRISNLHLFVSREDVFNVDSVLQETIIIKAVKTKEDFKNIVISESENMADFERKKVFSAPYNVVIKDDEDKFMLIPTSPEDMVLISFVHSWKKNLPVLGFRLKTGPVVDFRATEHLREKKEEGAVPLFWAYNYEGYKINYPINVPKKPQYIDCSENSKKLLIQKDNYLFVKRFTSKEEKRRVQCAIFLENEFSEKLIGVENHLNYITKLKGSMDEKEMYGLFVIMNSSYFDKYFRILNGSTQVNANEINTIPFPDIQDIISLGKEAKKIEQLTVDDCDRLIDEKFREKRLTNVV